MKTGIFQKKYLGKKVVMTSTHFNGEKGTVEAINAPSQDPNAFYGFDVKIRLDGGTLVTSFKSEDFMLDSSITTTTLIE